MINFRLDGKVALITGASYGIGFAIAKGFSEAGATICFNDINQELVDKGIKAYEEVGIKAHGYVCDVTNEEAVNALVKKIEEEVGVIDILVNNAGIIKRIPMIEMAASDFRKVIDVDLNKQDEYEFSGCEQKALKDITFKKDDRVIFDIDQKMCFVVKGMDVE